MTDEKELKVYTVTESCKGVSAFLKGIVNQNCEEGYKCFPSVEGVKLEASIFDLLYSIRVLDEAEDREMKIVDELEEKEGKGD